MPTREATLTRHVVRPWQETKKPTKSAALRATLAALRDAVSAAWKGRQNAVEEIREQRGGSLR